MANNFSEFDNINFQNFTIEDVCEKNIKCQHLNFCESGESILCTECGEELGKNVVYDKEYRYYGHTDTKFKSDPSRCKARKIIDKTIFADVEGIIFNDNVVKIANSIYLDITEGEIKRGNSRKALVFASIYIAYMIIGKLQVCDELAKQFNISKKEALKGYKTLMIKLNVLQNKGLKFIRPIAPIDLVEDIMNNFEGTDFQKKEIKELYIKIDNKSELINRSRPRSVAAGLVYYWIVENRKHISLKEFAKIVELSEMTITKIILEIEQIIEKEND